MKYCIILLTIFLSFNASAQKEHPEKNKVQETAHRFIKLVLIQEFEQAKSISVLSTAEMLDELIAERSTSSPEKLERMNKKMGELRKSQIIFGEFDFGTAEGVETCTIGFTFSTKPEKVEEISLKKLQGKWLVDMSNETEKRSTAEDAVDKAADAVRDAADAVEEAADDVEDAVDAASEAIED